MKTLNRYISNGIPKVYFDPLATLWMSEDEYIIYCMVMEVKLKIQQDEETFFQNHKHILSPEYRQIAESVIKRLTTGKTVRDTPDNVMLKSYQDFLKENTNRLFHRDVALIEWFKIEAGEMDHWLKQKGSQSWPKYTNGVKNREKAIRSLFPNDSYYRTITTEEVEKVIPYLQDSPKALQAAKEYLNKPL